MEVQLMTLLFSGQISFWIIFLVMIAAVTVSVYIYRRCPLSKKAKIILSTIRSLVLILLFGCFFQPVISRTNKLEIAGNIPVLLDNSGSMGIVDQYTKPELIKIAWKLNLFPKALRAIIFEQELNNAGRLTNSISMLEQSLNPKKSGEAIVASLETFKTDYQHLQERLITKVKSYPYLTPNAADKKSTKTAVNSSYQQTFSEFRKFTDNQQKLINTLCSTLKKHQQGGLPKPLLKKIKGNIIQLKEQSNELKKQLINLQDSADQQLADSNQVDVTNALAKLGSKMSRLDIVKLILTQAPFNLQQKMDDKGNTHLYSLDFTEKSLDNKQFKNLQANLPNTALGTAVYNILNQFNTKPVAGIVVFSDGNNNSGKSLLELKKIVDDIDVPILCVGVGNDAPPKDICIESVFAPTSSFIKDKLDVAAVIHRHGFTNIPLKISVKRGDKSIVEKEIPPGQESPLTVDLSFIEQTKGVVDYLVSVQSEAGEILTTNNNKEFSVNMLSDPIKALLVDEYPRWESRYLNMLLKRDARIKADIFFIASARKDIIKKAVFEDIFSDRKRLFSYDVLVLGDINPEHFDDNQLELITDFVRKKGGTVIFLAGQHYMPDAFAKTAISDLLPFKFSPGSILNNSNHEGGRRLLLTPLSKYDSITQVSQDIHNNDNLWQKMPPVFWIKEGIYPLANAETLVFDSKNNDAVMLKGNVGLGKVLYIGTDSFWRWRKRIRWKYHHKLWGQIMLWAISNRTSGQDKQVKLMVDKSLFSPGESIIVKARLFNDKGQVLDHASVSGDINDIQGKFVKRVKFVYQDNSGGEYRAVIKDLKQGKYKLVPHVFEISHPIKTTVAFEIKDMPANEYIHLNLDPGSLKRMASCYRHYLNCDDLVNQIERIRIIKEQRTDFELWDSFYLLIIVMALLAVEWHLRKKFNMV
jgi:hypothetical protein